MNFKRLILSAAGALCVAAAVFALTRPSTASGKWRMGSINGNAVGSIDKCGDRFAEATGTISGPEVPPTTFTTSGAAAFRTVANGWDPASTELQPVDWHGNTVDPELGPISWSFDLSRPVPNSTIVANQADQDFPATLNLYYHVRGTIGAFPGVEFESQTPLHMTSNNLMSYSPLNFETFHLAQPVQFQKVQQPGVVTFTLTNLTIRMDG